GAVVGDGEVFVPDVAVVVAALVRREWTAIGGKRLAAVLPWNTVHEKNARTVAGKALGKESAPVLFDVRVWVAAAMHAHRTAPHGYAENDLDVVLAAHIATRRGDGVRSTEPQREAQIFAERRPDPAEVTATLRAADRRAGAALARRLGIA
ncbi:MAG: hypothetical protein L0K86_17840, partial [Actinomycetia bacterium]|nr:hypothetical protein [Actinomycetes bacterium]